MNKGEGKVILVAGATGRQGGAVATHLLSDGWLVRAMTRNSGGDKAQSLRAMGADVVKADMEDESSLNRAFDGVFGAFSVQNPFDGTGCERETLQGRRMADMAKKHGVQHFIYASAGPGRGATGIAHFDSKAAVENHIKELGIPATVYRPGPFMELMTAEDFYPAMSTWGAMIKVVGTSAPWPWIAVDDIGRAVAKMFGDGQRFIGKTLELVADLRSLGECREIFKEVTGKYPSRRPIPVWLFKRMAGPELVTMWGYIKEGKDIDWPSLIPPTKELLPDVMDVETWVRQHAKA